MIENINGTLICANIVTGAQVELNNNLSSATKTKFRTYCNIVHGLSVHNDYSRYIPENLVFTRVRFPSHWDRAIGTNATRVPSVWMQSHAGRRARAGPCFNIKTVFPRYGIPILKIRRSRDRLIFNMGIPILVRRHIYIETAPWWDVHSQRHSGKAVTFPDILDNANSEDEFRFMCDIMSCYNWVIIMYSICLFWTQWSVKYYY